MQGLPFYTEDRFKLSAREVFTEKVKHVTADYFNTDSLITLINHFIENNFMFRLDGTLTWCKDIRFNYRDRYIYIPYYKYNIIEIHAKPSRIKNILMDVKGDEVNPSTFIPYNLEMRIKIVDDRRSSYRSETVEVYNPKTGGVFEVDISNLPYTTEATFSMEKLLYLHKQSIFYPEVVEDFEVDQSYLSLHILKKSSYKSILKSAGYKLFSSNFIDFRYQDIRQFKVSPFSEEYAQVDPFKSYIQRQYEFESYLYTIFAQELSPIEEEYSGIFNSLGVSKRFISLGDTYPLILKYYYKNGDFKYKRRTYEYFEVL